MLRIAIFAACIGIPVMAQAITIQPATPEPATETRTFALQSGGRLKIDSANGAIKILSWDKNEAELTARFRTSRKKAHSKIEISNDNNSLELNITHPKELHESGYVNLELSVPGNISGDIKTVNGSIALSGITGTINIKTTGGSIILENVSGNISASTAFGNVSGSIQNIEDNLYITTINGNIDLKLPNPNGDFTASVLHGEIKIPPGARDVETSGTNRNTIKAKYDGNAKMKFITNFGSIIFN